MNRRLSLLVLLLVSGLVSCSSLPRLSSHPTVAMLFLEPGGNAYPRGAEAYVILRAVDGEMVKDQTLPGGMVLRPGWSHVTLSARRDAGTRIGGMIFGEMGSTMGRAIDELGSTQFDRRLSFRAEAGHDYQARMKQAEFGYDYWIEDRTTGKTVADTRQPEPVPRW